MNDFTANNEARLTQNEISMAMNKLSELMSEEDKATTLPERERGLPEFPTIQTLSPQNGRELPSIEYRELPEPTERELPPDTITNPTDHYLPNFSNYVADADDYSSYRSLLVKTEDRELPDI